MKGITLILSVLILTLSLQPCSDGFNREHQDEAAISKTNNHSRDKDDSCPITCICNCCGMAITFESFKPCKVSLKILITTMVLPKYQSNYRFDPLVDIWQPPQVIS